MPNVAFNYSTLIVPFDYVTWALVCASILAMILTYKLMDKGGDSIAFFGMKNDPKIAMQIRTR